MVIYVLLNTITSAANNIKYYINKIIVRGLGI